MSTENKNHGIIESPTTASIKALRELIMDVVPELATPEYRNQWWLLGTSGCQLCQVAETLLARFQAVQPIGYQQVDIADFDEALMMQFATTIPVIITQNKRLNYPFSVMDLQQLLISQ